MKVYSYKGKNYIDLSGNERIKNMNEFDGDIYDLAAVFMREGKLAQSIMFFKTHDDDDESRRKPNFYNTKEDAIRKEFKDLTRSDKDAPKPVKYSKKELKVLEEIGMLYE